MKRLLPIVIIFSAILGIQECFACTGVYIGRKCSANGAAIIARSCDWSIGGNMPYLKLSEAVEGESGHYINGINGFVWEFPENTFRCITLPTPLCADSGPYGDFSINEKGVAFTSSVTGYFCKEASQADPWVTNGIAEETITAAIGPVAGSAREAVELLASLIDRYGHAECNIVMAVDRNEAWYMEIYSGHQYCAVKMPDDAVAVFGNEFMLDTVDPRSGDVICSRELFSLPERNGFAVRDRDGRMNLRRTYMGDGRLYDFSHQRTWRGHQLLSPSTSGDYDHSEYYPLFFKPDFKVDLAAVRRIFRDRYEGTQYYSEPECRVIGDESQEEVHIIEVFDNRPGEMACVAWVCVSEAAHAPFVPLTVNATALSPRYSYVAPDLQYDPNPAYTSFKRVNAICALNREIFSKGVKKYWNMVETEVEEGFRKVYEEALRVYTSDPEKAAEILTGFELKAQNDCVNGADRLFEEMMWHAMRYASGFHYGGNLVDLQLIPKPVPEFVAPEKPFNSQEK